jgi:hypothetical protein
VAVVASMETKDQKIISEKNVGGDWGTNEASPLHAIVCSHPSYIRHLSSSNQSLFGIG